MISVRPNATRGVVQLPAEWISAHEAIIDDETFNNVQLALSVDFGAPGTSLGEEDAM
jgi:hypothetical protein